MLEILLLILRIAGIIFVSVLGILIVVICFALFVPVRYRGDFSVSDGENGEKKKVCAVLRATWFLRFVRVYVTFEETVRLRVKVLFFTFLDTAKEKKDKGSNRGRKKVKSRREKDAKEAPEIEDSRKAPDAEQAKAADGNSGGREITAAGEFDTEETTAAEETVKEEETEVREPGMEETVAAGKSDAEERAGGEKVSETGERGTGRKSKKQDEDSDGIISRILQTIRNFCDKLRGIKEKAEKIEALWISDHMVSSRSLLGKQLLYLIRHTKPKNLSGYLRFGFDDPSTTGYAMALYGILYPIWSPKLSVEPDFERQILDCHILIKGKIRVWHFVRVVLRMVLSGDVRRVIKEVKKL